MANQFRKKLKRILLLGTLLPILFFVSIFFYKYNKMNLDTLRDQFVEEQTIFELTLNNKWTGYNSELSAKINLLDKQTFTSENEKQIFYDNLFMDSGIHNYYYLNETKVIYGKNSLEEENMRIVSLLDSKEKNSLWIENLDDDSPYLYIGYTDEVSNHSIVLQIDSVWLFKDESSIQNDDSYFEIYYNNKLAFKNHNSDFTIPIKADGLYHDDSNHKYFYSIREMSHEYMYYVFLRDISGEINFVTKDLILCALGLVIYFIIAIILLIKSSNILLKPLDILISRVTSVADGKPLELLDYEMDIEFKELLDKFEDLIAVSHENMSAIVKQSEVIEEKNYMMFELNNELEVSTKQIENSTKEWMIYEKQNKILVDNIKDLMWIVDTKGRITYINSVVEEKLGYNSKELLGVSLEALLKESIETEEILEVMFYNDLDDVDTVFVNKLGEDEDVYATSTKRVFINGHLSKIQGVSRDITEERFIQKQLLQKNEIANTLNEISEILTKPEKLEVLLHQIVSRIERLLEPYVCTIRLIDDEGRLELKSGIGAFYALVQEKYLDIDKDISGRAIKESKIIIVSKSDAVYYDNYDEVSEIVEKSKEIICLPLEYNDHVIGVMSIGLKENISDSQLKILKVFTNQASAAIEKARMYEELEKNYLNIIKALASTVEAKDAYTEDHSIRVSKYSRMLAETLGLSDEEVRYIDIAGLLHDIGKIGVSDLTLTKKGKLTDEEFFEIKKHPLNGGRIVSEMKLHHYIIDGVLLHHKRFDLKGYPDIYIDSLPISARIIGVADAFDAMTSNRSYQSAKSFESAYEELLNNSGTQFCPVVVEAMGEVIKHLHV